MIEEILKIAVNAPSGHNSQPWEFVIKDSSLQIWNVPDKDKILFNYKQRGSMVANGALIENIVIIASKMGKEAKVDLLPENSGLNQIATITFKEKTVDYQYQYLFDFIDSRTTNRRPFSRIILTNEHRKKLKEFSSDGDYEKSMILTENRQLMEKLSESFSVGDRLLFENKFIHKDLFAHVNWTLKEEKQKREGLYLMTKEMSLPSRLLFKHVMSEWKYLVKLNKKINFSEKAGQKRVELYNQASAFGMIYSDNDSPENFIQSGRLVQRFWLFTSSLGLAFQPMSIGLLYLGQMCRVESPTELTEHQKDLVTNSYSRILDIFNIQNKFPIFSFRIGYAKPPTASSLKKSPHITYI